MDNQKTIDVFVTNLPRDITETAIRNLFSSVGRVIKLKLLDDKKFPERKLCFVGYNTIDEAVKAVGIADKSSAFGPPMRAVVSKQSLEDLESSSQQNYSNKTSDRIVTFSNRSNDNNFVNHGRGSNNSFLTGDKSVILTDVNLKKMEMLDVEIIDLQNVDFIYARILKYTENSKNEIQNLLNKVNSSVKNLRSVRSPEIGEAYLAKWDDESFYRAELLEVLSDGSYRVTFVDEGTTNDIVWEIKQIPDGPLIQYPKQFSKLSLGLQQTNDKLKDFIIKQAEDKSPSIFWLGHKTSQIPVINLFLDDEEILNKFKLTYEKINLNFHSNLNVKFGDIPYYTENTEFPNVFMNENKFISSRNFSVQVCEPEKFIITHKENLKMLPSRGDFCIYEHKTSSQIIPKRCVITKRHRLTYDIELIDYSEEIKNVSIDYLYQPEGKNDHLCSPPASIHCELDPGCSLRDDLLLDLLMSEDVHFVIKEKLVCNKYRVFVEKKERSKSLSSRSSNYFPNLNLENLVGNSYQVFISHMVSPVNFYVQINKPEYMDRLADIHYKINVGNKGHGKYKSLDEVEIGQGFIAPYSNDSRETGDNFRAKILEKRSPDEVKVFFVDYGNDAWVKINKLHAIDESLISEPGYCFKCSLNLTIRTEAYANAFEIFDTLTNFSDGGCELAMEVLRSFDNKLIVELTSHIRGVLSTILINQRLCTKDIGVRSPRKPVSNGDSFDSNTRKTENIDRDQIINKLLELEKRVKSLEEAICCN